MRKNVGSSSIQGRGVFRELGIHVRASQKSRAWPVFMGSGLGPERPPGNGLAGCGKTLLSAVTSQVPPRSVELASTALRHRRG